MSIQLQKPRVTKQLARKHRKRLLIIASLLAFVAMLTFAISWFLFAKKFGFFLAAESNQWGVFGDFIGGFVGTIVNSLALGAVAWTVYQQAEHVDEQQRQNREIFLATQRPWIRAHVVLSGALSIAPEGITVRVHVTVENVGNSPALNTFARLTLSSTSVNHDSISVYESQLTRRQSERRSGVQTSPAHRGHLGNAVFPGTKHVVEHYVQITDPELKEVQCDAGPFPMLLHLSIFVEYRSALDEPESNHVTAMLLTLNRKNGWAIDRTVGEVPLGELSLMQIPWGDYAD